MHGVLASGGSTANDLWGRSRESALGVVFARTRSGALSLSDGYNIQSPWRRGSDAWKQSPTSVISTRCFLDGVLVQRDRAWIRLSFSRRASQVLDVANAGCSSTGTFVLCFGAAAMAIRGSRILSARIQNSDVLAKGWHPALMNVDRVGGVVDKSQCKHPRVGRGGKRKAEEEGCKRVLMFSGLHQPSGSEPIRYGLGTLRPR